MVPGHIESWLVIMDFKDVGLAHIPVTQLKQFTAMMLRNFRGRMFKNFIVNAPWVLQGIYNMVWAWLDPYV